GTAEPKPSEPAPNEPGPTTAPEAGAAADPTRGALAETGSTAPGAAALGAILALLGAGLLLARARRRA
ncbi:LPXTG cell wall anchor domain-containing protein, partial [Leucobacter sp. M11]|uniref:LPXTG cell wall anchor domain-containing protein n=1 Tax=Leucobacter sp. M11 TaxID=2993565 RepID=UPI002D80C7FF